MKKNILLRTQRIFAAKSFYVVIGLYILAMLSVIFWGIPGPSHPFLYQMDEWHQFMAVKSVFKNFSNNVPGAAHGTMFQFILSGLYLIPFTLFHLINPFMLKNSVSALDMQEKIFLVLRLNSLIFGVLTLLTISKISGKYLKTNPFIPVLLFAATPIWISLSNYFKYDIALTFWITAEILSFLNFSQYPNTKNYLICGILSALAFSTKVSAVPLFLSYLLSFFLFMPKYKSRLKILFSGIVVFIVVTCFVGIPDVLLGRADYGEFLYSNLVTSPKGGGIFLGMPQLVYLVIRQYPIIFGHGLFLLMSVSMVYWAVFITMAIKMKKFKKFNKEFFLFVTFLLFAASLIVLQLSATGNRSLVLLPFLIILCTVTLRDALMRFSKQRVLLYCGVFLICCIQIFESFAWLSIKLHSDPRSSASAWIGKNIPQGSLIGLGNIPIYQMLPDNILKDYYNGIYKIPPALYRYEVISSSSVKLPGLIIITNEESTKYYQQLPKKDLVELIQKNGYVKTASFYPYLGLYGLFGSYRDFYISNMVPSAPVAIYKKAE